ncbi:MAG: Flp family type IVb pilin [Micavibrio aeruginosavorus]|uniref:Flp family type IVb pilin n=1 Tax=Micavibrio aeruginosavorus TaxID=349221 RepID=A0A2W5FIU4_9BACT|nr:MAG: Flp family type IVb pilin [Micavibrio aeruginosavorus]
MLKLIALVQTWNTNEEGATAIEYGLIAAAIALAIAGVVFTLGGKVETTFTEIDAAMPQ